MRLNVVPQISTKDGQSNKNARLTNCLKESKKSGDMAVIRPGLELNDTYSGIGNGLIPFDGRLLKIYDDSIYTEELPDLPFPLDSAEWDSSTIYEYNDTVFYLGDLFFSWGNDNSNNTPATGSGYWKRQPSLDTFDDSKPYGIGDDVLVGGVPYYSMIGGNTGNTPGDSNFWSPTAPTADRWQAYATGSGIAGPTAASKDAAAEAKFNIIQTTAYSCATQSPSGTWLIYAYATGLDWYCNSWQDFSLGACSDQRLAGPVKVGTLVKTA